jgi:hypothetical protein
MARSRNKHQTRRRTDYSKELQRSIRRCLPRQGLPLQVKDARIFWTPRLLVTCALLWVWSSATTLQDRFLDARSGLVGMYPTRKRPGRSYQGFIAALCGQSEQLVDLLCQVLRALVQEIAGQYRTIEGWVVFGADGTKLECSNTAANEQDFGRAGKDKSAPQQFLTVLLHLGTGLPWAFRRGPARSSEREHLREMIDLMPAGSLLVADAGFTGYDLLRTIIDQGHSFAIRVGSNVRLLTDLGYALREYQGLVYLWPDDRQGGKDKRGRRRKNASKPLVLRLVRIQDGRHPVHLLSNVLDSQRLSDQSMARIYRLRWGLELYYRTLKQTMGKRKMLSDAPMQARAELDWSVIGLWMIGILAVEEAIASGQPPWRCSAASALRVIRRALSHPNQPCRGGAIRLALRVAMKDNYQRQSAKTARCYPRTKTHRPPGSPNIRMATELEVIAAQRFARSHLPDPLAA